MCFYVHKDYPNALIAEEDIPCKKYLILEDGECCSAWFSMRWVFRGGKCKKSIKKKLLPYSFWNDNSHLKIGEGLHSFMPNKDVGTALTFKAVIPKGATYYMNPDDGEYVSNKLVVFNNPKNQ